MAAAVAAGKTAAVRNSDEVQIGEARRREEETLQ
jgi:hypothetical protein